jgi:hypothetical protein
MLKLKRNSFTAFLLLRKILFDSRALSKYFTSLQGVQCAVFEFDINSNCLACKHAKRSLELNSTRTTGC